MAREFGGRLFSGIVKFCRSYAAGVLFVVTCVQLTFLWPYVVVIGGERANIFSGMLCAVTLIAVWTLCPKSEVKIRPVELIVSALLVFFAVGSAALSATPASSGWRTFVIIASGLGGYWSSRFLLHSVNARKLFVYFCSGLLVCVVSLILLALLQGLPSHTLLDVNPHPVCSRILMLSFAPMTLVATSGVMPVVVGAIMLIMSYAGLVAMLAWGQVSTAPIFPIILLLLSCAFLWRSRKVRAVLIVLLIFASIMAAIFAGRIKNDLPLDSQSFTYRYENLFFSSMIAADHPLFGIGARSPREAYLENYVVKHPLYTKEKFVNWTKTVTTSDNLPLSLLADFGIPFTLIYVSFVLLLTLSLVRSAWKDSSDFYPHPLALLLPIMAILMQSMILDAIYHPHVSWFFHILLGMSFMSYSQKSAK